MTEKLEFLDGRDVVSGSLLFGEAVAASSTGPGNWVQLSGADLSVERLGQRRTAVEESGGAFVGVVPEALLLPRDVPAFEHAVHVDVCRGFARVTTLTGGERIGVSGETCVTDCGLTVLEKRILAGAAAASVKQTRFDPLHSGSAELDLRSELKRVLPELGAKAQVSLKLGGESVTISADQLSGWCQSVWSGLLHEIGRLQGQADFVFLSPHCELPNLRETIAGAFGDNVALVNEAESRNSNCLNEWLLAELPMTSCWLLQTRPR